MNLNHCRFLLSFLAVSTLSPAENLLIASETTAGGHIVTRLQLDGNAIDTFGGDAASRIRAHLTETEDHYFRTNSTAADSMSQFTKDGVFVRDISPDSSGSPRVANVCRNFANDSVFFTDVFGGSNVIREMDNLATGASSSFSLISYSGTAGVMDLDFGGPAGSEALFALSATAPSTGTYRVAKVDEGGNVVLFFDSADLVIPYVTDVGSVAVSPVNGDVFVATTTEIVRFSAAGTQLGKFAFVDTKPSLDVAASGNLFVGAFNSNQIFEFTPLGVLSNTITLAGSSRIIDVQVVSEPLVLGLEICPAVELTLSNTITGINYLLQFSGDLETWETDEVIPGDSDTGIQRFRSTKVEGRRFWRLIEAP